MSEHPEAFEDAKTYEKNAVEHGSPFTWSQGESLEDMARPERIAEIRAEHEKRLERLRNRVKLNPLRAVPEMMDIDEIYGQAKACIACHK